MAGLKQIKNRLGARHLAVALASSALFTAGCANMQTTAIGAAGGTADASAISGSVKGGNQPVQFATVQLYTVGQSGYGSAGTLLASTTTNAQGGFGFTKGTSYTCPSGADPYVYAKVSGGNTTGNGNTGLNNSAAVFVAPLGLCSQIGAGTFVNISEVTTAATVAALASFINPNTDTIGANGTAASYIGVGNAFRTVANLVSQSTGLANTTVTLGSVAGGINATGVTITGTPEVAKLNTVANILSACINQTSASSATNCSTLFANAVPPTTAAQTHTAYGLVNPGAPAFPTATDTLQAALYMYLNPTDSSTSNRTNLFNLAPATAAPYQPTLATVPTDWSVAISYSTNNLCGTTAGRFFSNPYDLQFDSLGNLWLTNNSGLGGGLVQISNYGAPMSCVTSATGKNIAGGQVDIEGNVWYGDSSTNNVYRFTPASSANIGLNNPVNSVRDYATACPPIAIAVDNGSTYFTCNNNGVGQVYKIAGGATSDFINAPVLISNTVGASPSGIFPDNAGDLFVTSGSNYVTEVSAATGGQNFIGGYTSTQITGIPSPTYGVVVGPQNRVYITSQDPGASLTVLAPSGSTFAISSGFPTGANTAGLSNPTGIWLDGGQNSYVANNATESTSGLYGLSVIAVDGTAISASGNANGAYQKSSVYFNKLRKVGTDSSGNVWVTNDGNSNSITEVVGLGTPIFIPYSIGLQKANGSYQSLP